MSKLLIRVKGNYISEGYRRRGEKVDVMLEIDDNLSVYNRAFFHVFNRFPDGSKNYVLAPTEYVK